VPRARGRRGARAAISVRSADLRDLRFLQPDHKRRAAEVSLARGRRWPARWWRNWFARLEAGRNTNGVTGATGARHCFGGLLRERNFRLLWTGETVSGLGSSMAVVGVPLLAVSQLHAGTFAVAALTAAAYFPWLVIGLLAGAWVDRLPLRRLMTACDLISVGVFASVSAAACVTSPPARGGPRSTMGFGCRPMACRPGAGHDCYRVGTVCA
jgi:hypothetical protein